MSMIPLSKNQVAIVDGEDYDYLMQWKWHTAKKGNSYYAERVVHYYEKGKRKTRHVAMHRQIMGLRKGDSQQIDHINHCGLDNRKCNLRICSMKENHCNQLPQKNRSSGYKGVWNHQGKWRACITNKGKRLYLGLHKSEIHAAQAYNEAAKRLFGEFAYLNVA